MLPFSTLRAKDSKLVLRLRPASCSPQARRINGAGHYSAWVGDRASKMVAIDRPSATTGS